MKNITFTDAISYAIEKIRIGHANNSSSSHSIVIGRLAQDASCGDYEYGWENFVLSSPREKDKYMRTLLYLNLKNLFNIQAEHFPESSWEEDNEYRHSRIIKVFTDFGISLEGIREDIYIDHQSIIYLPLNNAGVLNIDFWRDLTDYIVNNDFSILGGNDNSEYENYSNKKEYYLPFPKSCHYALYYYALKDTIKDIWIIKNKLEGSVVTLNFNKKQSKNFVPASTTEIEKTGFPLLIDLNVIDKCNNNCPDCYRDCTKEGKIANDKTLDAIIKVIAQYPVVDIVIGGGDVSLFKDTFSISYNLSGKYRSISTTIHQSTKTNDFNSSYYNSIAISLTDISSEGLDQFKELYKRLKSNDNKNVVCQIIFENIYKQLGKLKFMNLIKELYESEITYFSFVGYKESGRAKKNMTKTIESIKKGSIFTELEKYSSTAYGLNIYFDSVMIERYGNKVSISNKFKVGREGVHSCYIDAVNMYMAKNSYSEKKFPIDIKTFKTEFLNIWNKI